MISDSQQEESTNMSTLLTLNSSQNTLQVLEAIIDTLLPISPLLPSNLHHRIFHHDNMVVVEIQDDQVISVFISGTLTKNILSSLLPNTEVYLFEMVGTQVVISNRPAAK